MIIGKDLKRMVALIPDDAIVRLGGSYKCDIVSVSVETSAFNYLEADLKLTEGWSVQNDKLLNSAIKMNNEVYEKEIKRLGRLAEIAKAQSKLEPYIDQMVRSLNEEIAKLPSPPPGFFYGLFIKGIRREGDKNIIESEIGLRPITEPKNEENDETKRNNSTP